MSDPVSTAPEWAEHLVAHEAREGGPPPGAAQAVLRVCDLLRGSLSKLVGLAGYRSLLARALTLAQRDAPELASVEIKAEGTLSGLKDHSADQAPEATARGGVLLVARLLALLHTFIGANLTLRLLQEVWPDAGLGDPEAGPQETSR